MCFNQLDNGVPTWSLFPSTTYGAVDEGGYLPHVAVTSLSLSLGDINPNTGMPTLDGPYAPNATNQTTAPAADPDTLMASTYGQGEFAINLAPLILGDTVSVAGDVTPGSRARQPARRGRSYHHRRLERDHRLWQRDLDHCRRRDQSG